MNSHEASWQGIVSDRVMPMPLIMHQLMSIPHRQGLTVLHRHLIKTI